MKIALEILTFVGGCLWWACKGQIGRWLLSLLGKVLMWLLHLSEYELDMYKMQRAKTIAARRSNKARVR